MKKFTLYTVLVFAFVLAVASSSMATGICLDNTSGYCNDFYMGVTSAGTGVYGAHGYEYGCGYEDRLADGSLRVVGGYAYIGISKEYGTISTGLGDNGMGGFDTWIISLSSMTGTTDYNFIYLSGGSVAGHSGGPNSAAMSYCSPPPTAGEGMAAESDTATQ